MRFGLAILLLVTLGACSSLQQSTQKIARSLGIVEDVEDRPLPQAPDDYKRALDLLREEKYADALGILNDYVIQEPTSAYIQAATLNIGRALEGLGRWSEATERYRSVVVACEGVAPKLQAMALYRLSFCYEGLADDTQTVAVLVDLEKRTGALPNEIARAELPARLAAAYARVGNFDRAVDYYKKAEAGIAQLKRGSSAASIPEWLPKTLYFMGSMSLRHVSWNDFELAFRPLARGQIYLLEASEFDVDPWSGRAAKDLIATYRDLWTAIETAPVPETSDPIASRRQVQEKQWDRVVLVIETLNELRARFSPNRNLSQAAKEIEQFAADVEKRTAEFLARRPVGDGLTPESEGRRTAPRGRVISPDHSLEKSFIENARAKDPNL